LSDRELKSLLISVVILALLSAAVSGIATISAQPLTDSVNATSINNSTVAPSANITTPVTTGNATVIVTPAIQSPGKTILILAEGFENNVTATISLANIVVSEGPKNVTTDSNATEQDLDTIKVAETQTDGNGTLFYALGIPSDGVLNTTVTRIDNTTGTETSDTTMMTFQGTLKVIVVDEAGNRASAELTIVPAESTDANTIPSEQRMNYTGTIP
jgi:hypothetical protein